MLHKNSDTESGIYEIVSPSGGRYIGSAVNFKRRWDAHLYSLKRGRHPNRHLQSAWKKYAGKLIFRKLIICMRSDLIFYEQLAIDGLKPKYNIAPIAGSNLGVRFSEEARLRQKVSRRSNSKMVVYRGSEMTLPAAIHLSGCDLSRQRIAQRLVSGWDVDAALDTPKDKNYVYAEHKRNTGPICMWPAKGRKI